MPDFPQQDRMWDAITELKGPGKLTLAAMAGLVWLAYGDKLPGLYAGIGLVALIFLYQFCAVYLGKQLSNNGDSK